CARSRCIRTGRATREQRRNPGVDPAGAHRERRTRDVPPARRALRLGARGARRPARAGAARRPRPAAPGADHRRRRARARRARAPGTVAVVAGGADVVYPREHAELQAAMGAEGVVVAESPLGTEPRAHHVPRRNRIISGLSLGVVVVEAALKSGSLITARYAG